MLSKIVTTFDKKSGKWRIPYAKLTKNEERLNKNYLGIENLLIHICNLIKIKI